MCTLCNCRLCSVKHRTLLLGKLGECTLFCLVQCTVWAHYRCAHLLFVSTVYYIAHCAQHWAEHWCSNWGRRILTICEHCELCTELCAISTMYCSLYCCALCSNWSTGAVCTVLKLGQEGLVGWAPVRQAGAALVRESGPTCLGPRPSHPLLSSWGFTPNLHNCSLFMLWHQLKHHPNWINLDEHLSGSPFSKRGEWYVWMMIQSLVAIKYSIRHKHSSKQTPARPPDL